MTDMTKTVAPKTDQLNADDFFIEATRTIKITTVRMMDSKEQPIAISYEGDNGKPWKPSLGMRRVLLDLWGQEAGKEADKYYPGRFVTLYRDPDVKFGKDTVGGIRISHASHINSDKKIALTVSKARRVEFVVRPIKNLPAGQTTQQEQPSTETENPVVKAAAKIRRAIKASPSLEDLHAIENDFAPEYKIVATNPDTAAFIAKEYRAREEVLKNEVNNDIPFDN